MSKKKLKCRTIVMVTSSKQTFSLHFTKNRPKIAHFSSFFYVFLMHSSAFFRKSVKAWMVRRMGKNRKNQKMGFFFTNIFFLKVKMDMVFMSIFKKKDRIFITFFHFTGLNILASNILLSQKKSEISICPNRGYVSDLCA